MRGGKSRDVERLASSLSINGLHYENIREREEQLRVVSRWTIFREMIEVTERAVARVDKQRPDYLKITR